MTHRSPHLPYDRYINATYDVTEKDLVLINWHRLKCEAALPKPQPKKKSWIERVLGL